MNTLFHLSLILVLVSFATTAWPEPRGTVASATATAKPDTEKTWTILGTVSKPDGNPAASFEVRVEGSSPTSTYRAETMTDELGHYKVDQLNLGEYVIFPSKRSEGYFMAHSTISTISDLVPRVLLDDTHRAVTKDIKLDSPSGMLQGEIRDAQTRELIKGADLTICRTSDPDRSGQASGEESTDYKQRVPAGVAMSLYAQKPGYYPILLKDIIVDSLQVKNVDIFMVPLARPHVSSIDGHCNFPLHP
jgi:hypothetical protein